MTPLLTCCGGVNGRQTVPRAELQAFLCFFQRTTVPANATAVSDATTAWFIGLNNLAGGVAEVAAGGQELGHPSPCGTHNIGCN